MHHAVLLQEAIEGLGVNSGGSYIDATAGEGGHLSEIAKRAKEVLGLDRDDEQIKNLELRIKNYKNVRLVTENFADIERVAKENGFFPVDGVLFDLGLSIAQIKNSGRGFSYKNLEEPLDMRIGGEEKTRAAELINGLTEQKLYELFAKNSEELNSRNIAQAIVRRRTLKKFKTVGDLVKIINKTLGSENERSLARVFQALRIEVNNEFEDLKKGLRGAVNLLKPEGRIAVLTFHSLEDRIVKKFVRENAFRALTKHVISGDRSLPYERSAKLRIFIKS